MPEWIKNWFSNMLPLDRPFVYDDIEFATVENFYQAMKAPRERRDLREKIAAMPPHAAKRFARRIELRPDWEQIKVEVMRFALRQKFAPGTSWYERLLETEGQIVERNNWHDNFYGDCMCGRKACESAGANILGRLLMELRSEYAAP